MISRRGLALGAGACILAASCSQSTATGSSTGIPSGTIFWGGDALYRFKYQLLSSSDAFVNILMRGNGNGASSGSAPEGAPQTVLANTLTQKGVRTPVVVNQSADGARWADFTRHPWPGDHQDLLICNFGTDEADQTDHVNAMTADMRRALITIRTTHTVSDLSILIVSPLTSCDPVAGKDDWIAAARQAHFAAARDFNCAFFDAGAFTPNAAAGKGVWMHDDCRTAGTILNIALWSAISDAILPPAEAALLRQPAAH